MPSRNLSSAVTGTRLLALPGGSDHPVSEVRCSGVDAAAGSGGRLKLHRLGVLGRVEDRQELGLVEDHLLPAQPGQVIEAGQLDRLDRAGLLAHPAVNAPQLVDDEALAVLLAVGPGLGGGRADDVDAVRRAGCGAEHAGDALDAPLLVLVQPVHAPVIGRRHVLLLGILHRDRLVAKDNARHVLRGDAQPVGDLGQVPLLRERQLRRREALQVRVIDMHGGTSQGISLR